MKGDFSRNTFDASKHFSRVLMQQGRAQLDADWNEQASISLHYLRMLATDLVGPHWGSDTAFTIAQSVDENNKPVAFDFSLGDGNYYVKGIPCENESRVAYKSQAGFPFPDSLAETDIKPDTWYLAYLDVWERHLTSIELPNIREVALAGPDTATRAQIVWQVKLIEYPQYDPNDSKALKNDYPKFLDVLGDRKKPGTGRLQVRAMKPSSAEMANPCNIAPKSNYRGENQFYRVEIHHATTSATKATFKWSRDNGSVVFPVRVSAGTAFTLNDLSRGSRTIEQNNWVELMDDIFALRGEGGLLLQVATVNKDDMTVTLNVPNNITIPTYSENDPRHPFLHLWDSPGEIAADLPTTNNGWIPLEDGIEIKFDLNGPYKSGDYWWFPARVATGDVEWPQERSGGGTWGPATVKPKGIIHHYAPLAILTFSATDGKLAPPADQRRVLNQLWK